MWYNLCNKYSLAPPPLPYHNFLTFILFSCSVFPRSLHITHSHKSFKSNQAQYPCKLSSYLILFLKTGTSQDLCFCSSSVFAARWKTLSLPYYKKILSLPYYETDYKKHCEMRCKIVALCLHPPLVFPLWKSSSFQ